jgi:pilus assembly protein Flp/PilA
MKARFMKACFTKANLMKACLTRFLRASSGTTAIEYAIIAAGVAVAIVAVVNGTGASVSGMFNTVLAALK